MDQTSTHRHPVLACAERISAALDEVAGVDPGFMTTGDQAAALVLLSRELSRLQGLRLRLLAASSEVAAEAGQRDAGAWLAHRTKVDRSAAARELRLAQGLDERWHRVAAGLAAGAVNVDQARVVVRGLDMLRAEGTIPVEVLAAAEAHLVERCGSFTPRELERLTRHVVEVVAPDVYDDEERRRLEREERRAFHRTSLTSRRDGHGMTTLTANVPDAAAARLLHALAGFTSPRTSTATDQNPDPNPGQDPGEGPGDGPVVPVVPVTDPHGERLPYSRRLGLALCALLERLDPDRLPRQAGDATTLIVTIDLDTLLSGLGAADLHGVDGPTRITAGQARRLACTAGLIPAVLGGDSVPLDLGRAQRLHSPHQRKAMLLRDQRCRADGCTIPAAWCESHHLTPWSHGGHTTVHDGVLLCSYHHHRIHDPGYGHHQMPNGDYRFHRRT